MKDIATICIEANGNECTNCTRGYAIDQENHK
jgi:hypothetical protein